MKHSSPSIDRFVCRGVTLIELIAFIVIASVVATAMLHVFSSTLHGSHFGKEMTQGAQLAQQRMEVIYGQRKTLGYSTFVTSPDYDPCKSGTWVTQLCSATSGYTVTSTAPAVDACGTGCSEVTVTVTGPSSGQVANLTLQVWNY